MRKINIDFLLVILIFIETLCNTYLLQTKLYYTVSILYFLSGLGLCFLPLLLPVADNLKARRNVILPAFLSLFFLGLMLYYLPAQYRAVPVDYHIADMLPRIKIYAERFLNGRYVYDDVKEIWNGNLPPYLPATWMPFIPAVIFGFDMRWVPACVFMISLFLLFWLVKDSNNWVKNLLILCLPVSLFFLINFHLVQDWGFWAMTYEGLIAGYYLLLCLAIISWNPYLIGAAISLCLLSRFSLAFWVPFFLLFIWWRESFLFAVKVGGVILVLVAGLFVFPFLLGHVDVFLKTIDQYRVVAADFWSRNRIDNKEYNQVGLYKFFTSNQLPLLRNVQLVTTMLAPPLFLAVSARYFPSFENKKILIGLCSLKITLLFFFSFIEMPFHYLFITPTIISYAIGFYYLSLDGSRSGANTGAEGISTDGH